MLTWQSLMIPGLHNDDKWRMVEDEFVAVAHKFTAHLHAAEYKRLKERVQEHNADGIRSISRPVTGPMTDTVKRRRAARSLRESQRKGIKTALSRGNDADEADADELPWAGTNLQELMNSPRKKPVHLTRMVSAVPCTRAAALSRQHSTARGPSSLAKPSGVYFGCDTTARISSARTQDQIDSGNDDLGGSWSTRHPAPQISSTPRFVSNASKPRSTDHSGQAPPRATPGLARKSISVPIEPIQDDSDSPVETMFDLRARHHKRNVRRRTKSSTPDATKDDSQQSQEGQEVQEGQEGQGGQIRQIQTALSIPSL